MGIKECLQIMAGRKWVIIVTTVVTMSIAAAGTLLMTPLYQATATLRVATAPEGSFDYVSYNTVYADRLMSTYTKIATSAPIRGELEKRLGLDKSPSIKVDISPNTELIQITVEDHDPTLAAKAANTLTDLLIAYVQATDTASGKTGQEMISEQLTQAEDEVQRARSQYERSVATAPDDSEATASASRLLRVKEETYATLLGLYERVRMTQSLRAAPLSVIELATIPQVPSQPRKELNIALGLVIGLLSGVGLAFLLENLDTTLHSTEQIEQATERAILGKVPSIRPMNGLFPNGHSPESEAFRHIRTSLLNLSQDSSLRTLLVTSANDGEGKSTIAANLAHALAQSGRKVLLIDCDMRLPTLHRIFDLPNELGLSDLLSNTTSLYEVVQHSAETGVWVITSGALPANPAELLGSSEMTDTIRQATQRFDIIMLDTPSLLAVTDATVLAPAVDVVMLVVACAQTRQNAVKAACRLLDSARAKSVGVVVNRTEHNWAYGYYVQHHTK